MATATLSPTYGEPIAFPNYDTEGFYDEMFDDTGRPRAPAEMLARRLASLSEGELQRRQKAADLALLNMGITFAVYGHQAGTEKIWPFDLIPRIIDHREWKQVEEGLRQRITALNLFIDDLYHDQKIVRDGVFPAYMAQSSKCFLNRCAGLNPPKGIWCHITGTDLVRDNDGQMYVLEDNLRCPSGVSYVLENREVMKRTFPQVFDGLSIVPVEDYPEQLLKMLQHIAPPAVRDPNVVVLTPGIYNSAYFEHCFLAQQMGVELVQGSDLVVSDGFVHMRTTHGLQRVDVIYRRIDDDFLDPLCFRPDSALGVPGLMDVYRAGRVALANAPGTGIADDKAVYAYVPQIIKYYLGEQIKLPNVPTFICADEKQREHVLANLDKLVVKPTNESGGYGIMLGPRATPDQREKYRELILAHPRNYVAQPMLSLSRVPTLCGDHLEGRHVDLRPYILYGEDIYILPGGLTRVALVKGSLVVNSSQGGGSKDTWVLKNGTMPAPHLSRRHRVPDVVVPRWPLSDSRILTTHTAMLSRVADSIYWMSCYVERAENVARFIDVNLNMSLDLGPDMDNQWAPLVYTTGDHREFDDRYGPANQEKVIRFLTFDEENRNSILACLSFARENARTVREMLSSRMWEELNKFYLLVRKGARDIRAVLASPFEFFDRIKQSAYVLEGVAEATMSHGEAWHFRRVGRMLERADKTSRILDVKYFLLLPSIADVGTPLDTIQWASLLKSTSALEMYRQTHGRITPAKVAEFLILDRDFPRAMRFCLIRAEQSLLAITGGAVGAFQNRAELRLGRLRAELDYTPASEIIGGGMHEFIDGFQTRLIEVGEAIFDTFFATQSIAVDGPSAGSHSSQSQLQHATA